MVTDTPPANDPDPPSAEHPLEDTWEAFERLAIAGNLIEPKFRRALKHAFYAGARSAFNEVIAAMQEQDAGDINGERRFAAIEREVNAYFAEIMARATIAGGRVS